MAYVENMTVHDAGSHVMEFPDTIGEFVSAKFRDEFRPYMRSREGAWIAQMKALHDDPDYLGACRT